MTNELKWRRAKEGKWWNDVMALKAIRTWAHVCLMRSKLCTDLLKTSAILA
jgi:hypothetical protein